jgi:hypothetical protein
MTTLNNTSYFDVIGKTPSISEAEILSRGGLQMASSGKLDFQTALKRTSVALILLTVTIALIWFCYHF